MTETEINEAVAEKLNYVCKCLEFPCQCRPDYCHSIEAAFEIVEYCKNIEGASFRLSGFKEQTADWVLAKPGTIYESGIYEANFVLYTAECDKCGHWKHSYYNAFADTAPMAIALAFLKLP